MPTSLRHKSKSKSKTDHCAAMLCAVAATGSLSCPELAAITGLSAMTIKRTVDDLLADGALTRGKGRSPDGGRLGTRYTLPATCGRLILDLTSPVMTAYLFQGCEISGAPVSHDFEPTMSVADNLSLLLNRLWMSHPLGGAENDASGATEEADVHTPRMATVAVAILTPSEREPAFAPYREAYQMAAPMLTTLPAALLQAMDNTLYVAPARELSAEAAILRLTTYHPAARKHTAILCLEADPPAHATLCLRNTPADVWFLPTDSAHLPAYPSAVDPIGLASYLTVSPSLLTPRLILSHGVDTLSPSLLTQPLPLAVLGASFDLLV